MTAALQLFGHKHPRANRTHSCWCCGRTISPGERYFITTGKLNGKMFAVKHCRTSCECTAELIDQNPQVHQALFSPTIATWEATQ